MQKKIDLHIHTTMSDGEFTPKEVIDEAYRNRVSVIAIADHDTIDAYNEELFLYAESKNIKIINAVEISTKFKNVGVHILGYNFNLNDKNLIKILHKLENARQKYLYDVNKKLNELGYFLNIKKLEKINTVTKAHIALDIINNQKNKEKLLNDFKHIPSKGEFIESIMNENCKGYVKKETITPKQCAKIIREAGGKVVLAHPVSYKYEDNLTDADILEIIEDIKADGLEANYIYINRNNERIDEIEKWNRLAKENDLFVTIGSDFHTKDKIRPEIGFANIKFVIEDEVINEIITNLTK